MKMTSLTHPLRIDQVPVPGTSGVIGMTLCPGKVQKHGISGHWERDLETDLQVIQSWGTDILVSLLEQEELAAVHVPNLADHIPDGLLHFHLPIKDGGVPDSKWEKTWGSAGAKIRGALGEGGKVVIHCLGGLGRTGTVAARLLVDFGMTPKKAINAVRKARPGTIENDAQVNYILHLPWDFAARQN